jgi:hypothetical protein
MPQCRQRAAAGDEGGFGEFTPPKVAGDKNNTTQSLPGVYTRTRHLQLLPGTTPSRRQPFLRCPHERKRRRSAPAQRVCQTA